jgi:hypothetical protein
MFTLIKATIVNLWSDTSVKITVAAIVLIVVVPLVWIGFNTGWA